MWVWSLILNRVKDSTLRMFQKEHWTGCADTDSSSRFPSSWMWPWVGFLLYEMTLAVPCFWVIVRIKWNHLRCWTSDSGVHCANKDLHYPEALLLMEDKWGQESRWRPARQEIRGEMVPLIGKKARSRIAELVASSWRPPVEVSRPMVSSQFRALTDGHWNCFLVHPGKGMPWTIYSLPPSP